MTWEGDTLLDIPFRVTSWCRVLDGWTILHIHL